MKKSALELQGVVRTGASVSIDGSRFNALELQGIARAAANGASLTVRNADRFSTLELQGIGRAGEGKVHFELDNA